jgi:hypothetical protein
MHTQELKVEMRDDPDVTIYSKNGNVGQVQLDYSTADYEDVNAVSVCDSSFIIQFNDSSLFSGRLYAYHYTASAEL